MRPLLYHDVFKPLEHQRVWCNGEHATLPRWRSGFDSRHTQVVYSLSFLRRKRLSANRSLAHSGSHNNHSLQNCAKDTTAEVLETSKGLDTMR